MISNIAERGELSAQEKETEQRGREFNGTVSRKFDRRGEEG